MTSAAAELKVTKNLSRSAIGNVFISCLCCCWSVCSSHSSQFYSCKIESYILILLEYYRRTIHIPLDTHSSDRNDCILSADHDQNGQTFFVIQNVFLSSYFKLIF